MEKQIAKVFFSILIVTLSSSNLFAEDANNEKKDKKLPKSGSLSSSINDIHDSRSVPGPWGGVDVKGEDSSPITGSVSKVSARTWQMRVFNNSESSYSVSLAVNQFNKNGTKTKTDSFSYTLKPGGSAERSISSLENTVQCTLDLVSWKKIGK